MNPFLQKVTDNLQWQDQHQPALLALIRVLVWVLPILILVPGCIWWERRLLSWMQDRIGPNRVGNLPQNFPIKALRGFKLYGLLQPIADGVKLFFKEDITPAAVDKVIYFFAPALALFPAFALGGTLPWGPSDREGPWRYLTPIWGSEIGILYILAISSLGVYGVVLAGYASNNKYSLLGGLRSAAQLISYELAMGVSLAAIVLVTGSLKLTTMVAEQEKGFYGAVSGVGSWLQNWFIFTPHGFIAFVIFLICMVAESNRAPFDLPEAENEIIAGYHTEYSSMKFAVFFMGEYAAMLVFSGLLGVVFLGGYNMLPIRWEQLGTDVPAMAGFAKAMGGLNYWLAPFTFLFKAAIGLTFYIWLRATLPRLRYDQLMSLGWKFLLPAAVANFIVASAWVLMTENYGPEKGWALWGAAIILFTMIVIRINSQVKSANTGVEKRTIRLVDGTEPAAGNPAHQV